MKYIIKDKTPKYLSDFRAEKMNSLKEERKKAKKAGTILPQHKRVYNEFRNKQYSMIENGFSVLLKYCWQEYVTKKQKDENSINGLGIFEQTLLKEQGELCVYCNKRIPEYEMVRNVKYCRIVVEHWHPESSMESIECYSDVDYSNMFLSCRGGKKRKSESKKREQAGIGIEGKIISTREKTCDYKKDSNFIFINPLNEKHINLLKYTGLGEIYCLEKGEEDDEKWKNKVKNQYNLLKTEKGREITYENKKKTKVLFDANLSLEETKLAIEYDIIFNLNLNEKTLLRDRQFTLNAVKKKHRDEFARYKPMNREEKNKILEGLVQKYLSRNSKGQFDPYVMVKIYYLKSKIKY